MFSWFSNFPMVKRGTFYAFSVYLYSLYDLTGSIPGSFLGFCSFPLSGAADKWNCVTKKEKKRKKKERKRTKVEIYSESVQDLLSG